MPDIATALSKFDERYGLPTAGFAVASLAAFILALKDGFHLVNHALMVSGMLFSIACSFYCWHNRDQSSGSYTGETQSLADRFWEIPLRSVFASVFWLALAALFGYLTWRGGRLPGIP